MKQTQVKVLKVNVNLDERLTSNPWHMERGVTMMLRGIEEGKTAGIVVTNADKPIGSWEVI